MTSPGKWLGRIDWRSLLLALAITATQVIFATMCARGFAWNDRYLSLWTWDGGWYADILEKGYRSTDPPDPINLTSNVAFFPAYPLLARAVQQLTGFSVPFSLLLTSQLAAFVFWWALLRQLRDWKVASSVSATGIMIIFCHPTAFYMIVT